MSRTHWIIGMGLIGAASLIAVNAVSAHRHGGGYGWHMGGGHYAHGHHHKGRKMLRRLKRAHADNDGKVTLEEFLARREARFTESDVNKDGALSAEEVVRPLKERADYRVRRMIKRFDADGDDSIIKAEFEAPARKRFAERDFNGDGQISDDERPPRMGKGPGRRGGPPEADEASDEAAEAGENAGEGGRYGGKKRHEWHRVRSLDKLLERRGRLFERIDANGDGVIEAAEIGQRRTARIEFAKKKRMHVLDVDRDGSISRDEFLRKPRERFSYIDLDGNGVIEAADLPPRAARRWNERQK